MADGRIYSGRQAKANRLVDAIGREADALKWLNEVHEIPTELPIVDVQINYKDEKWREFIGNSLGKALFSERLRLDGVLSLWQPDSSLD